MIGAMTGRFTSLLLGSLLVVAPLAAIVSGCGDRAAGREADAGAAVSAPPAASCDDPLARVEIAPADRAAPRFARNFRIEYQGRTKRVTVVNPWRNSDLVLTHLLVPCGDPAPPTAPGVSIFRIPVSRVATTSTTQLSHFVALGIVDRLAGQNRLDFVLEPEIRQRIEAGRVAEIGDGVRLDVEALLALRPDLILVSSIGDPEVDGLPLLDRARLPYVVDAAWTEETPLGRAEWVKLTAAFFNREAEADQLFDQIAARYAELAAIASKVEHRPTVLVGTPFQGTWHVSGGASYLAKLIADAGGAYLWADDPTTGSIPLDFESVYARGLGAEVWLHPYGWHSLADGVRNDERMADFAAWKSGRVYNNDARANAAGGNDYFETGSLRPDLILADLIEILHPGLIQHELVFHRKLPRS
jgi:iron complex transport system substrate-binding protein